MILHITDNFIFPLFLIRALYYFVVAMLFIPLYSIINVLSVRIIIYWGMFAYWLCMTFYKCRPTHRTKWIVKTPCLSYEHFRCRSRRGHWLAFLINVPLCGGRPVIDGFPAQSANSIKVVWFFFVRLDKVKNKQSSGRWNSCDTILRTNGQIRLFIKDIGIKYSRDGKIKYWLDKPFLARMTKTKTLQLLARKNQFYWHHTSRCLRIVQSVFCTRSIRVGYIGPFCLGLGHA